MQSLGESAPAAVLDQLLPLVKPASQRSHDDYGPEELLVLFTYVYSVTGEQAADGALEEAEARVKKALAQALCEEPELSPLLQKITGECAPDGAGICDMGTSVRGEGWPDGQCLGTEIGAIGD